MEQDVARSYRRAVGAGCAGIGVQYGSSGCVRPPQNCLHGDCVANRIGIQIIDPGVEARGILGAFILAGYGQPWGGGHGGLSAEEVGEGRGVFGDGDVAAEGVGDAVFGGFEIAGLQRLSDAFELLCVVQ